MKLWKIWQDVNDEADTYDAAIVAAESEDAARRIHPNRMPLSWRFGQGSWCPPEQVKVELIGEARDGLRSGVVLASFNPE